MYAPGDLEDSQYRKAAPSTRPALSKKEKTAETLNLTLSEMHDIFRLFYISGMGHCSSGPGAWLIGQPGVEVHKRAGFNDSQHNILLAMVDWVENDGAPVEMIGTKFNGDEFMNGTILAQKKHCVYPNASRWDGMGDTKVAESWNCQLQWVV
jgi:feruloyl esterase